MPDMTEFFHKLGLKRNHSPVWDDKMQNFAVKAVGFVWLLIFVQILRGKL